MNLASNTAPPGSTRPSSIAAIHLWTDDGSSADVLDRLTGITLVLAPVEVFGHGAELHHQDVGQVLRLDLPSFFALKTDETGFVAHHDDPGVGAANDYLNDLVEPRCNLQYRLKSRFDMKNI